MELQLIDPYSPDAARIWTSLDAPSFFTSWGWIENWLACLPADRAPLLAVFRDAARASAACLGRRRMLRRRVIPTRSLHLNATGVPRLDDLVIEYNGLIGAQHDLATLLAALPEPWDEIELPGIRDTWLASLGDGWRVAIEKSSPVYHVDLEAVRASGYLAKLSSSTRSQVRRAQKAAGAITVEIGQTPAHALEIYDELCALHTATWRARGKPGAFADAWLDRFHRRLIATRFEAGEIQLVRVRAGASTLGCLYNFVYRGRVLQYQTGLRGSEEGKDKPGYVCHTAAIEHCAAAGLGVYDFLAGDHRYKKSLSTANDTLIWCKVQRPRWRFAIEDKLVELVRSVRSKRS